MQEPYKGLRPYEEQDQENFFGREAEKQVLVDKILANKLTLLFAASGVGKSSLLQAAVIPQLRCVEGKTLDVVYHKNWFVHPTADLKHALRKTLQQGRKSQAYEGVDEKLSLADFLSDCTLFTSVPFILVLDQFEEFFTSRYNLAHREEFVEQLAEAIQDRETETIFVIAMREDFAMEMEVFRKFLPSIFDHLYRLKKLSLENARNAIVAPLTRLGFQYEPALLEELLKDLGSREQEERSAESVGLPQKLILSVEPPHLQIICTQLWEAEKDNPQRTITQVRYHRLGRAKGLLKSYFLKRMNQFSAPEQRMVSRTFDVLVSQYGTKSARPLDELAKVVEVSEAVLAPVLDKLDQARVLRLQTRHSELWYELYHDVFAEHVVAWNEEYKNQQRWYKVLQWTGIGFALSVLLVVGYDTWMNAVNHHFRLSVKAGISDMIEVWQGKQGSWDRWGQQTFHYETDYGRGDLEADKLFVQRSVEELANLHQELIGSFPLAERLLAYRDDGGVYRDQRGKPGVALCLATASIYPYRQEVSIKMIDELRDLRSVAGFNTLAELVIQPPNDGRQEPQNMLESTYAPPTVWKPWLQKSDTKVHNLAVIALGKLGHREVVPQLIILLKDSESTVRSSAIRALIQLGAREAIPQITDLLKDSESTVPSSAIEALSQLEAREAIPQITNLLKDSESGVRRSAIEALIQLGAREAIPQFTALLKDSDPEVRKSSIEALSQLGSRKSISKITNLLKDSDSEVRWRVIKVLSQLGAREAIPQITTLLKSPDSEVRKSAIIALSQLGAREAIPQITDWLNDSDPEVRKSAIEALNQLGAREKISKITALLNDSNSIVRSSAIGALIQLGAREAIPQITDWLKDSNRSVRRRSAIEALRQLGARKAILQNTDNLLKDLDSEVRWRAIKALNQLEAREAIPKIIDLLKDSNSTVRSSAIEALSQLGAREAIPQITDWLKDSNSTFHSSAIEALSQLGAREKISEITALLNNSNSIVRSSAIKALSQLGARKEIPQITDLLKDSNSTVRLSAIGALIQLGAREAIPQITDLLKDSNSTVRSSAIGALIQLGAREAIPQITALLKDSNSTVRSSAIGALSQLGAREAIPQIIILLKDSDLSVRLSVIETLSELGTREAILQITTLLKDSNWLVRRSTIGALSQLGVREAIPQITTLLKSPDSGVRWSAINALNQLGVREATPQITALLKDSWSYVRSSVAATLGHFHQQQALPKEILIQISDLLQSPNSSTRSGAAEALSQVYRRSSPVLKDVPYERLLALLQDPVFHIRQHAVQALQSLGIQQALPALRPLLQDPNTSVRWATVGALIALKEPNAVEHLITLLKSFKVEADVLTTLAGQEEAWQTFLTRLHTQTPSMKIKVLTAVTDKMFAPLTSTGFAQFLSFLEDPDAIVRWQTMRAVERVFAGGKHFAFAPPMEKLKTLLFNPQEDLDIRYRAFKTLGHLHSEEAAQILLDFLQQKQETHPDKPSDKPLFMLEGIHLLGNLRASIAQNFLIERLMQITQDKQAWRARRDQVTDSTSAPSTGNFCQNQAPPQQEEDKWPYQQWETELGYALARIDAQQGLKNLSHPLASVRKGTWTALGQEPDARLLQPLIDLRATADGDIAPITRHAAFRAIDLQLMTLEFKGTTQDLAILKALKTTDPAILDRLEWTIGMLEYRCVEKKWCGV